MIRDTVHTIPNGCLMNSQHNTKPSDSQHHSPEPPPQRRVNRDCDTDQVQALAMKPICS